MATTTKKKTSKKKTTKRTPKQKAPRAKSKERNPVGRITEQEHNAKVAEMVQELSNLEAARYEAYVERAAAQDKEKKAQKAVDEQTKRLLEYQNSGVDGGLPFDGESEGDQETNEPERPIPSSLDQDTDRAIRGLLLEDLNVKTGIRSKMIQSSGDKPQLITFGDLTDYLEAGKDQGRGLRDLGLTAAEAKQARKALQDAANAIIGPNTSESAA